jgi:hypothetical protein
VNKPKGDDGLEKSVDQLWQEHLDAEEDLRPGDGPFDPSESDFAGADKKTQKDLMRRWFLARYCDPAEETPYEDGYIWVWGGPYDPREQLSDRFSGIAIDKAIDELAAELYLDVGAEWAPISDVEQTYYERLALELDKPEDPLSKVRSRLAQTLSVLDLQGDAEAMAQVPRMVFGATISALEAYLWETVAYWVQNDREVVRGIVSKMPDLKDKPIKLGQVFDQYDAIETSVMLYLQNLVWHRWDKVAQLFRFGFDIKTPSFRPFEDALIKRHDIVHRSGHDKEGNLVTVSVEDARALAMAVEAFAKEIYDLIKEKNRKDLF